MEFKKPTLSDYLPFEIETEIIKRVRDVELLLQFRSVCKPWKSFIDSPEFIAEYHIDHPQPRHHILVRYNDPIHYTKTKYLSIVDDFNSDPNDNDSDSDTDIDDNYSDTNYMYCDTEYDTDDYDSDTHDNDRLHKFSLTIPLSVTQIRVPDIFGSSQGLFCFYGNDAESDKHIAVMWNPTIRKSVTIEVPNVLNNDWYETVIGFGVSPHSNDPKLVKIQTVIDDELDLKTISSIPKHVEVFSLSTREWRTLSQGVPRLSVSIADDHHVVIDKFIFWLAYDRFFENGMLMTRVMIMLFDMISEEFMEIYLPNNLTNNADYDLSLSKIQDSLAVVGYARSVEKRVYNVWMMKDGVWDSFTKMYTISRPEEAVSTLLSFRHNGDPIIGIEDESSGSDELFVYDPDSEQISPIGIFGTMCTCYVGSYMETLLLLDQ